MSRPLRTLIVDDEKPARQRLLTLLRSQPGIEVAGDCAGGEAALRTLEKEARSGQPIDIVFLDVQMPEIDGFDVLDTLFAESTGPRPVVILVTAYDQYALRAFDAHAVDYLLKPYSDERFEVALHRAAQFVRGGSSDNMVERMRSLLDELERGTGPIAHARPRYLDRIVLKERGRAWLLPTHEIRWINAAGVYVEIHTTSGKALLHRELLGELEKQLDPRYFVRIHRSHLVSLGAIEELLQDSHGAYTVILNDGTQLKLSRSYRTQVQERLGQSL
jgi:two-component system, LytTR family, response regulator